MLPLFINPVHILIHIYRRQKKLLYFWAAFLKGTAALFLLAFFSYFSIYYSRFLFHHIADKPCFSPGCRSPPLFVIPNNKTGTAFIYIQEE